MYNTFSEIMAEKTLDYVEARKANIMMENNIEHDGSCDEVHPDKSHEEWEEDQEEFVQNEQMNNISTDDMRTQVAKLGKGLGNPQQSEYEDSPMCAKLRSEYDELHCEMPTEDISQRCEELELLMWSNRCGPNFHESVISKIQECYSSKMPVNINIDGEQLQINPTFARDIILLHDELNEENQAELRELIESDNIESFAKVMKFTEDRN